MCFGLQSPLLRDMKRTKILATYGPAVASRQKVTELVAAGVNAFRINCSHGTTADFEKAARLIRSATRPNPFPVGILFDLSGPKLRLDRFAGELSITAGETLTLTADETDLTRRIIAVNHEAVIRAVRKRHRVFIDDGALMFEVVTAGKEQVTVRALNSGLLLPAKGINLPDSELPVPTVTDKDRIDIETAVRCGADYIAISFVRSVEDVHTVRFAVTALGGHQKLIAKLEKREAIDALDEILEAVDGVMVARGDLGVELPPAELPRLQKRIISAATQRQKPVIVATQMLESMRFSPRPTRAEVNDVASAVFDMADAVMLSAETATGKYPEPTVRMMAEIIRATEEVATPPELDLGTFFQTSETAFGIASAVTQTNVACPTTAICCYTNSGFTAEMIANLFPPQLILALTPNAEVAGQLALFRSVYALRIRQPKTFTAMLRLVEEKVIEHGMGQAGDMVTVTGGAPFGSRVPTNFLNFHQLP